MVSGENIYYNAADLLTSGLYEFGAGPLQDTPGHQQIQVGGIFSPMVVPAYHGLLLPTGGPVFFKPASFMK